MADRSSKTDQPTQRRLEKAREEGQFPSAREFVGALQFMVFLGLLGVGGAHWWAQLPATPPLALGGRAVALATLAFRLITTRFGFSLKKLAPDPARLNPLSRLRELPRQNLPSLFQAVLLLPLN